MLQKSNCGICQKRDKFPYLCRKLEFMYSLNYKVTTSTCDSEGKLKLFSALQMMQDCSEIIGSEASAIVEFTK